MTRESEKLRKLFSDDWSRTLREFPELATYIGHAGLNDRWTDWSEEALERRRLQPHATLAELETIDRSALDRAEKLDYDLFLRRTREELESQRYHDEYMPLTQLQGVQQDVGRLIAMMPAFTISDYESVIERLRGVPKLLDQTAALMRKGVEKGLAQPRICMADVPRQLAEQLACGPAESSFVAAFSRFPETVPARKRESLRKAAVEAVAGKVYPAFRKFGEFIGKTYLPRCRSSIGLSALPDGQAWYAFKARHYTTTRLEPKELHELGRAEVARIRAEMDRRIRETGFRGTFEKFSHFMRTDKRFFHTKPSALVAEYRDICKRIDPGLVRLFGRLPRQPYGVIEVPEHARKSAPTAYYQPGSLSGGRPGWYFTNTYKLKARPRWEMETLSLHEAVPGHHLQIALAREMQDVPEFRKHDMHIAFVEGWALYAESLGDELDMYKDPYSKLGQLSYEAWRASRLVIDTGIHAFGWSRKQAIEFLTANTCKPHHDAVVEVDRYVALPGQALAYKVGELAIKRLRARAEKAHGGEFDVRGFHDALLENAALPLDVLEELMGSWIESRTAR